MSAPDLRQSSHRWAKRIERERSAAVERESSAVPRGHFISLLGAFVATRLIVLFAVPMFLSDIGHYLGYARQLDVGLLPYRDFVFEYPPLALLAIWIPKALQTLAGSDSFEGYRVAYWGLFFAIDCAAFALIARRVRSGAATALGAWVYVVGGLLLAELLYDRFDLILGALTLAATAWAVDGKRARSALALAAGVLFKLVPIALGPLFALESWRRERTGSLRARAAWPAIAGGAIALGFAAAFAAFGEKVAVFLEFHRLRGIQIESTWSSLQWAADAIAPQAFPFPGLVLNYGAMHLQHASDALELIAGWAPLGAVAALTAGAVFAKRPPRLGRLVFVALLAMVACGKVLSPQYLIWPLCLAPLAGFDARRARDLVFAGAFLALCALTAYEFHGYMELIRMDETIWTLVCIRNLGLVALALAMAFDVFFARPLAPVAASTASASGPRKRRR